MGRHTQTINCKVLLVCLLVAVCRGAPTTSQDKDEDDDGFKDVRVTISALDDVISWAKAHHYLLIVDFLFSIRVAQGKLDYSFCGVLSYLVVIIQQRGSKNKLSYPERSR